MNKNYFSNITNILNDFQKIEEKILEVQNSSVELGLETLINKTQIYYRTLKRNFKIDSNDLGLNNPTYFYFCYHETLMRIRNFGIYSKTIQNQVTETEILQNELLFFENVYNCIVRIQNKEIVAQLEINAKAKKIQKWVQLRFSKWLKLLYALFKVQNYFKKNKRKK